MGQFKRNCFTLVFSKGQRTQTWFYIGFAYGLTTKHLFRNGSAQGQNEKHWCYIRVAYGLKKKHFFYIGVAQGQAKKQWCCTGFAPGKRKSYGFTLSLLRVTRKSIGCTLVLLRIQRNKTWFDNGFALAPTTKQNVLQWFCSGSNEKQCFDNAFVYCLTQQKQTVVSHWF